MFIVSRYSEQRYRARLKNWKSFSKQSRGYIEGERKPFSTKTYKIGFLLTLFCKKKEKRKQHTQSPQLRK